jgi:hypothetical protein
MKALRLYLQALADPALIPTGLKVAATVGTLLFLINHGAALRQGAMTRDRWLAGLMTYIVPYMVNIHGQYTARSRANLTPPNP